MTVRPWVRLDNASNIFLAARSDVDPKVFRISAEMDRDVNPRLLQKALDTTFDRYPLYSAVLRSGVFWYYLLDSDLRPTVMPELQHTCAAIYHPDRRTLLFRVVHHRRRITLEIFHALSDGTGALWFLSDLVAEYARLRYDDSGGGPVTSPTDALQELTADSFTRYFRRRRRIPLRRSFGTEAESAVLSPYGDPQHAMSERTGELPASHQTTEDAVEPTQPHRPSRLVRRVRGTRTPDNRPRLVELTVPAADVLALARAESASITMYLTALFFESIRRSDDGSQKRHRARERTFSASVPVNLRQFFPSTSARNFFATVRVEHTYGDGPDDVGTVARRLEAQFRPKASAEFLARKLRRLIRFERMVVLRIVPRVLKDVLLRLINWVNNRGLTVAVSNLGRVALPEPSESHVGRMLFHVSAVRPQFCAMSHGGMLTISFTSPFVETDHVREFARFLSAEGIDVRVAAARVTEDELEEAAL